MIYVCPLSEIEAVAQQAGASHVMTLINEATPVQTPSSVSTNNHLRLTMNDINEPMPGLIHPTEDHVTAIIEFALRWDQRAPMVVHCWAGISRSTAAAYTALCSLNSDVSEHVLANHMRQASPTAHPNRLIISLADRMLGRSGRMVEAIEAIGRGEMVMEGQPFALNTRI